MLVELGFDPFQKNVLSQNAFEYAASNNYDLEEVLYAMPVPFNQLKLIVATTKGDVEAIRAEIASGVDVNKGYFDTALEIAAATGRIDIVNFLIDNGAEAKNNANALRAAIEGGNIEIVKLFIEAGANQAEDEDNDLITNNLMARKGRIYSVVFEDIINSGDNINQEYWDTFLERAVRSGNIDIVQLFIDSGAEVKENHNALRAAVAGGYVEMAQLLVEHGAEIAQKRKPASDPLLTLAAKAGHIDMVQFLIQSKKVEVNEKNASSVLAKTIEAGHIDVAKVLIDAGADINFMFAPLEAAIKVGRIDMVKLLIDNKVDLNSGNSLRKAAKKGDIAIVKLLV